MIINRISHSRLGVFYQCNYKYKLKYHDKIKIQEEKDYLEFGNFIHLAFELAIREGIKPEEAAKRAYQKHYRFGPKYKDKIPRIFRNFYHFNEAVGKNEIQDQCVEREFEVPVEEFDFYGFIDRDIRYKNGKALIVDYKTGKNELTYAETLNDGQLMKYVYVFSRITEIPIENIYSMLFYVNTGNKHMVSFTEEKIEKHIQESIETARKILEMDPKYAKANITKLCGWCEFKGMCNPYQQSKS